MDGASIVNLPAAGLLYYAVLCCAVWFHRITRSDLGSYKPQVVGLPVLLFVTGVVSVLGEGTLGHESMRTQNCGA